MRVFAPAAACGGGVLLVFGLLGGWLLAGRMLAPLLASPTPHARPRPDRSPTESGYRAAETSSANSPTPSTPCLPGSKRTSPNSRDSPPTPPTNCAPRWRSHRHFSTWPATIRTATTANSSNASAPSTPERSTSLKHLLLLSRADQQSFTPEPVDLSLIAEEATETLLPFAEKHGVTIETSGDMAPTIGSEALLLQLTTNLVHNAIVHNLPEQGTVWVTTSVHPESVVLTVENTGEKLTPELVATLVEPFQRGTERIRTDHAGVGLGLAIVKSITQAHDGTLTLAPRAAGGLCVTVQLTRRTTTRWRDDGQGNCHAVLRP